MEYQHEDLGAYHLHLMPTKKFKTTTVIINLRRPCRRDEVNLRSLLTLVLFYATAQYPTRRLINIRQEELYNLDIAPAVRRLGNTSNIEFKLNFVDEKYTEKGMTVASLEFFFKVIFDPLIVNGGFDEQVFNLAKQKLLTVINNLKDNKRKYAVVRLLEVMDLEVDLSFRLGYLKDLEMVTPVSLYQYYLSVLKSDLVDIVVLGNFKQAIMSNQIRKLIPLNTMKKEIPLMPLTYKRARKRLKRVTEVVPALQTNVVMGCKLLGLTKFEQLYVLPIFADILGGAGYSKLFRSVREKHSLAYFINAQYRLLDQLLVISAGINAKEVAPLLKLVKKELQGLMRCDITKKELVSAQNNYISLQQLIMDDANALSSAFLNYSLLKTDDLETRIEKIKTVTRADLKKVSKKIRIELVYCLEGNDTNEEN